MLTEVLIKNNRKTIDNIREGFVEKCFSFFAFQLKHDFTFDSADEKPECHVWRVRILVSAHFFFNKSVKSIIKTSRSRLTNVGTGNNDVDQ